MSKSSKDIGWDAIFEEYDIYSHDFNKSPYYINSKEIKIAVQHLTTTSAKEVRILCYQASRKDRPQVFVDRGIFILPIKNGYYALVKGEGYIDIPEIKTPAIEFKPSIDFQLLLLNIKIKLFSLDRYIGFPPLYFTTIQLLQSHNNCTL